jgi:hypothetical protein
MYIHIFYYFSFFRIWSHSLDSVFFHFHSIQAAWNIVQMELNFHKINSFFYYQLMS